MLYWLCLFAFVTGRGPATSRPSCLPGTTATRSTPPSREGWGRKKEIAWPYLYIHHAFSRKGDQIYMQISFLFLFSPPKHPDYEHMDELRFRQQLETRQKREKSKVDKRSGNCNKLETETPSWFSHIYENIRRHRLSQILYRTYSIIYYSKCNIVFRRPLLLRPPRPDPQLRQVQGAEGEGGQGERLRQAARACAGQGEDSFTMSRRKNLFHKAIVDTQ